MKNGREMTPKDKSNGSREYEEERKEKGESVEGGMNQQQW